MSNEDKWTPGIGLARGLCTGAVAGLVIGALLIGGLWMLVDPPRRLIFSNYSWARMGLGSAGISFGYAWLVIVIAEWAGGMSSVFFCALGACCAAALGTTVALISFSEAGWVAGAVPPVLTALIWVALPAAVAGCFAALSRTGPAM